MVQYAGMNDGMQAQVEFNDPGSHNIFTDSPGLGLLSDNGGPTLTQALLPGSPALRAGSPELASFDGQPLSYDQRGLSYRRDFSAATSTSALFRIKVICYSQMDSNKGPRQSEDTGTEAITVLPDLAVLFSYGIFTPRATP
jgi:hypothetical protein